MAWRDSRKSRGRLFLFTVSIVLGISALVAISSFGDNLEKDIEGQAAELLGADLEIETRREPDSLGILLLDSLGQRAQRAEEVSFPSMAFFPKTTDSRLIEVRALEGNFPFYGKLETEPAEAAATFQQGQTALVDQTLMLQFQVSRGDTVRIGQVNFAIAGTLLQSPGRNQLASTVAPVVYIPKKYLEATGLVRKGSRVNYSYYYLFEDDTDAEALVENLRPTFRQRAFRTETIEERKEEVSEAFQNLTRFLNLVGFIALLLGALGVASAVHVYMRSKISTVAVLRCLGVAGNQAFAIYLIQMLVVGAIGSLLGVILGMLIQQVLPIILQEFLPFEASTGISLPAAAMGFVTGIGIAVLFALLPLLAIRKVSPLYTLRASYESNSSGQDPLRWAVFAAIFLFVLCFAYLQIGEVVEALAFTGGLAGGFLLLVGVGRGVMWAVRRFFPRSWSFLWRQSLANLYRPNNQTLILIISIGLGTAMISTLFFVQSLLLKQLDFGTENSPNIMLFDIQPAQLEDLTQMTRTYELPVLQSLPVVTMRVNKIKEMTRGEALRDSALDMPRWVWNSELRVTFRDTLMEDEEILAGTWRGRVAAPDDTIFISLEEGFAERTLKVEVGDPIEFNVQGAIIPTVVGSIRKMEFDRMNFLILFPAGSLDRAPMFHLLTTRADSISQAAQYQQAVVKDYPTVSVIDLGQFLTTLETILGKISFVIRFMALFSIATGLLVLVGSVIISKYQRIQESVLLRTLGASRRQILAINAREYFLLGALAALTGILLALGFSWALAYFSFEAPFAPNWIPVLLTFVGVSVLTVSIGLINLRGILNKPPLEVLRKEV